MGRFRPVAATAESSIWQSATLPRPAGFGQSSQSIYEFKPAGGESAALQLKPDGVIGCKGAALTSRCGLVAGSLGYLCSAVRLRGSQAN
jgi:hypothetical protein